MKKILKYLFLLPLVLILSSCQGKTYTVMFDYNDPLTGVNTEFVKKGNLLEAPAAPTKEGHTFIAWNQLGTDKVWDFNKDKVNNNLSLSAAWKINQYIITFNSDGGRAVEAITADYGQDIIPPEDPIKEGFVFVGWAPNIPYSMPAENITLTAQWEIIKYTLTFDYGSTTKTFQVEHGSIFSPPTELTKTGHNFLGWSLANKDELFNFTNLITNNLSFVAKWEPREYTVTFKSDNSVINSLTTTYNSTIDEPNGPTKTGYTFLGWFDDNDTLFNFADPIQNNLTLTAKWEKIIVADAIIIDGTKTIYAEQLWNNRDLTKTKNLKFVDNYIQIENPDQLGVYESGPIEINKFLRLVLSWNVLDLENEMVAFMVSLGSGVMFTSYYIMGMWKHGDNRSFASASDGNAAINDDLLVNQKPNEFDSIKLKFVITSNSSSSAKIKNISVTTKKLTAFFPTPNDESFDYDQLVDESLLIETLIDVPVINQMSVPNIGNKICSPTSLTMVLRHYNKDVDLLKVAEDVEDKAANIYGNWTFNASYVANFNLEGRVEYINDFNEVVEYIKNGIPVIISVGVAKYAFPGTKINYPSGHLMVLIGFTKIDGHWYGIINDAAVYSDDKVRVNYHLKVLLSAMSGYSYIVIEDEFN